MVLNPISVRGRKLEIGVSTPADYDEIVALYHGHYPWLGWSRPYIDWQYLQNPAGKAQNWVARADGKIVASYTAVPFEVWIDGKTQTGWRMQDLFTRPEFGGLGIYHTFSRLAKEFTGRPVNPINFTFPNEKSHRGFIHTGWQPIFRVPLWTAEVPKTTSKANVKIEPLASFGAETDRIWKATAGNVRFAVNRSSKYLNWRYFQHPFAKYFPFRVGDGLILILKLYEREDKTRWTHICDAFHSDNNPHLLEAVVDHTLSFAQEHRTQNISGWSLPSKPFSETLKRRGFILQKELPRWVVIQVNREELKKPSAEEKNWHVSMGDSDVY